MTRCFPEIVRFSNLIQDLVILILIFIPPESI